MPGIHVRPYHPDDAPALAQILFDAVHQGTRDHYSVTQRQAWAPKVPNGQVWLERLRRQSVFVAEENNQTVGFMTLQADGCIDLAFIVPDRIGFGIAHKLYTTIEAQAASMGMGKLTAHASHLARPFFERQGWTVVRKQTVIRDDIELINFIMEKSLD
jgi:putative acetyltransferase